MKLKILLIVCSNQEKDNSSSYKIAQIFKERGNEFNDVDYEILSIRDYKIEMCKGCCACFKTGECLINDDMNFVKEKLLKADHIIFITPVYAHNVTGLLKNFIDRTSNWLHIFGLLGKTSSTIVVSSSNGNVYVSEYLKKTLEFYGTIYIGNLNITVDKPRMLDDIVNLRRIIDKHLSKIVNYDRENVRIDDIEKQSGVFLSFKKMYTTDSDLRSHEEEIWLTDNCLRKSSFIEAYETKRGMQ